MREKKAGLRESVLRNRGRNLNLHSETMLKIKDEMPTARGTPPPVSAHLSVRRGYGETNSPKRNRNKT